MSTNLAIDVGNLDASHRRALEEVIGRTLSPDERLLIEVAKRGVPAEKTSAPVQSIEDWAKVYEGLSEEEIEAIDKVAKTRAMAT